jgi:PAS domain S-box-containing protein
MTTQQVGGWAGFRQLNGEAARADLVTIDLIDILDTIDVPIVVIGQSFVIASFNRAAAEMLRLEPSDIGRSPRDTLMLVGLAQLEEWCAQAMATGAACRHDFHHGDRSFVLRISPYIRSDHEIGTVLTFTNVTAFRASVDQAIYEREYTKTILNTIADPIVVLSPDLRVQAGNRAFYAMFGISRDQTQGVSLFNLVNHAFELPQLRAQLEGTLTGGRAFQPFEMKHDFPVIGPRTIMLDARLFTLPRQSRRMIVLVFHDITARKQSEATGAYLASIVESSDDAIVSKSLNGIIKSWNKGAERLFGYAAEEMIGKSIAILIPQDRSNEEPAILERVKRGERVAHYETVRMRKDGSLIDISLSVSPIKDVEGKIVGASKIARDNTGKKKVEEVQRLLLGELQHRVKNTLAIVQAIATLTLHGAPADEREKFIARLHALGSAHDVLTQKNWERAPVRDILNRTLEPFQKERIKASGPDVTLDSQKALALTMVLHELATNAVKYGSLSNDSGQVRIDWTVGEDHDAAHLKVCWEERDGPLVQAPARKGFGSRVIEASLKSAQVLFAPEGITCTLEVSL